MTPCLRRCIELIVNAGCTLRSGSLRILKSVLPLLSAELRSLFAIQQPFFLTVMRVSLLLLKRGLFLLAYLPDFLELRNGSCQKTLTKNYLTGSIDSNTIARPRTLLIYGLSMDDLGLWIKHQNAMLWALYRKHGYPWKISINAQGLGQLVEAQGYRCYYSGVPLGQDAVLCRVRSGPITSKSIVVAHPDHAQGEVIK